MDLNIFNANISEVNIEKKTKFVKTIGKKVLTQNNNKNICSFEESEEEFSKCQTIGLDFVKPDPISESIPKSEEIRFIDKDLENSYNSNNIFNELIQFFSKALKLSLTSDFIHEKYLQYLSRTQSQKDSSKTDYTYAHSFSYNKNIKPSEILDWEVPNMSRKGITSVRTSSSITSSKFEISDETKSSSLNFQSTESRRTPVRTSAQMFTRSQCLGGSQCEAPGCLIHKSVRKRTTKSDEYVIPYSGSGLEPEIEFSEEEEDLTNRYNYNNQMNYQRQSLHQNGGQFLEEEEEEEEITIIRRVNNIFRTTINNTSRFIDSFTPNSVKAVANKCSSVWPLFFIASLLLVPLVVFMRQNNSSLWPESNLDGLTGDMSSKNAINQLLKEIKAIKSDIQNIKEVNNNEFNNLKHRMTDKELNGNEKFEHLNNKIDLIEEYLANIAKNCCKNETDSILALIDIRLSQFMSSMLTDNQSVPHLLTATEAAEELKRFIRMETNKRDDNFKQIIERELISTIDRIENKINKKPDEISSNVTIDEIKSLISQALAIYDADKTGQPDFALEPAGGTIVNTRCSETFDPYGVQYKIFGMPVWSSSISPRAVIQPTISPGECWAFKGSTGYLVIKLSQPIIPNAFSYEHIPKQISRDGNIDSAPKEFQIRGLEDETDTTGHLLGNYVYEDNERPMQYFEVQDPNPRVFQFIELVILSNHGHKDYTCLYRFRVHGKRVNQ